MKKRSLVIIGAMLFALVACQKENVTEETGISEMNIEQNSIDLQEKRSGEFCRFTLQIDARSVIDPITGNLVCRYSAGNVCAIVECIPDPDIIFELPPVIWDPCLVVPCGIDFIDPWIINERINPKEFRSFKELYELRIDESVEGIPFALNKNVLGVQFYETPTSGLQDHEIAYGDPTPQPSVFYLENKIVLDPVMAKKMGLQGNVILPGKYPVMVNKEDKTHNLLVVVENGF